ncbi:RNA-binding protein CP29B, chloroplastic-like protein [Drosera capensis]
MAAASLSLSTLSFTPKLLSPLPLSSFKSLQVPLKPLSLSLSPSSFVRVASRIRRYVSASSGILEEDEGEYGDEEEEAPRRQERRGGSSQELKIFVGNLPYNVDSARLAELFEAAGAVDTVEVVYDKLTGRSKGFAFVTMSSIEDVEPAARQFNGYELEGRPLRVNAGPPPPKTEGSFNRSPNRGFNLGIGSGSDNRVHVSNLSWDVDESALKDLFSEHGEVVEAKVIYDRETGKSRGFGFVTYNSAEEVNNAIDNLDGAPEGVNFEWDDQFSWLPMLKLSGGLNWCCRNQHLCNWLLLRYSAEPRRQLPVMFAFALPMPAIKVSRVTDVILLCGMWGFVENRRVENARMVFDEMSGREIEGKGCGDDHGLCVRTEERRGHVVLKPLFV